jgi:hypothetical protein
LFDEHGQFVLITQGLSGYTLVAGKKILFRLYLDLSAAVCPTVVATITYKYFGFQPKKTVVIPASSLIIETESPNGPSVGVLFSGDVFPRGSLGYDVDFHVQGDPTPEAHFRMTNLVFQTPGRLRLLIHNLVGRAPWGTQIRSDFGWLAEMYQSLERLSAMMPIRDGTKFGLQHTDVGLCFIYGDEIDTWPEVCPSGNGPPCTPDEMIALLLAEAQRINGLGTSERVDATVSWRPRDYSKPPPPEGAAGQGTYDAPTGSGLAVVVGGKWVGKEMTGAILAQELGHVFGCEPPDSPHYEDPRDGKHSKTPGHNDPSPSTCGC